MMRKPVKARGEVPVKVAGKDLILCATMENLDAMEQATNGLGLSSLMAALADLRLSTIKACLFALCIEGDAEKAWFAMVGAGEVPIIQRAIIQALAGGEEDDASGNAESAAGKQ